MTVTIRHSIIKLSELRTKARYLHEKYINIFYDLLLEYTEIRLALLNNTSLQEFEEETFNYLVKCGIKKAFASYGITLDSVTADKYCDEISSDVFNTIQDVKRNIFITVQSLVRKHKDDTDNG